MGGLPFYGVRNKAEMAMQARLHTLAEQNPNFHLHLCMSTPQPANLDEPPSGPVHIHQSRVDVALLRGLLPLKPYQFYICGPTPMLQSLVPSLEDWGVPDGRIHFEAFGPASIPRKNSASGGQAASQGDDKGGAVMVTFAKSGRQEMWEPGTCLLCVSAPKTALTLEA